jgi:hypothetical protein
MSSMTDLSPTSSMLFIPSPINKLLKEVDLRTCRSIASECLIMSLDENDIAYDENMKHKKGSINNKDDHILDITQWLEYENDDDQNVSMTSSSCSDDNNNKVCQYERNDDHRRDVELVDIVYSEHNPSVIEDSSTLEDEYYYYFDSDVNENNVLKMYLIEDDYYHGEQHFGCNESDGDNYCENDDDGNDTTEYSDVETDMDDHCDVDSCPKSLRSSEGIVRSNGIWILPGKEGITIRKFENKGSHCIHSSSIIKKRNDTTIGFDEDANMKPIHTKMVQFDDMLSIREYNTTVGVGCAVNDTCPIQLDWDYYETTQSMKNETIKNEAILVDDTMMFPISFLNTAGVHRMSIHHRRKRIATTQGISIIDVIKMEQSLTVC